MNVIKKYIRRQYFDPGLLGIFINPFYLVRKELRATLAVLGREIRGKTLDVGCGDKPYEKIFKNASSYLGMEFDSPENRARFGKIDVWYDGGKFPFENAIFDSIIATQVLEHVFNPKEFLSEIARVTKSGGYLLLTVPFVWDEHEKPHDFARYSSFGLAYLLKNSGFEIKKHIKTAPDTRVIFQLAACFIHKKLEWIGSYWPRVFCYVVLISPLTILGIIFSGILPENQDLYMDNVVLAQKI